MSDEYLDSNENGIPDAFENRPSISEILNADETAARIDTEQSIRQLEIDADNTLTLELDLRLRPPLKGETYLFIDQIRVASYNHSNPALIIKRVIAAPSWWKSQPDF